MGLRVIGGKLVRIRYLAHDHVSSGAVVTVPASVIAGDYLLLIDHCRNLVTSPPANVLPSGFTQLLNNTTSAFGRLSISRKLATGADAGATVTGMSGVVTTKALVAFRPNIAATSLAESVPGFQATGGNPSAQNIASGSASPPLVAVGIAHADSTDPSTLALSPAADLTLGLGPISQNMRAAFKYYDHGQTPADVSADVGDHDFTTTLASFYFRMVR